MKVKIIHRTTKERAEASLKLWEECSRDAEHVEWGITVDDGELLDACTNYDIIIVDADLDKDGMLKDLREQGVLKATVIYHSDDRIKNTVRQVCNYEG